VLKIRELNGQKMWEEYRKIDSALCSLNKKDRDKGRENAQKYGAVVMLVTRTA
jgi:hypothetical protein